MQGYLPNERPRTTRELVLFALQQLLVMMPATVTVALITGFHVSTTIFASGFATLAALAITKGRIPLYYGSSFAYLAAIGAITVLGPDGFATDETIRIAQFGIIVSGVLSIAAGVVVRFLGMGVIKKVLPGSITGPVAAVIGLSLSVSALTQAIGYDAATGTSQASDWVFAILTILVVTAFTVVLKKGILSQIPILLGIGVVYVIAAVAGKVDFSIITGGGIVQAPHFTLPQVSWPAALAIAPIAIATIPESTAHLVQLDSCVNSLVAERRAALKAAGKAEQPQGGGLQAGLQNVKIEALLWLSLIADGVGDIAASLFGGPGGTNYGENLSTMMISKVYSWFVIALAAVFAILASFFAPLSNLFRSIPSSVFNGACIYLFGVIAWQGIGIMRNDWEEVSSPRGIAVSSTVLILGIGGSFAASAGVPFFGMNVPAIAFAAIAGIVLNGALVAAEKASAAWSK